MLPSGQEVVEYEFPVSAEQERLLVLDRMNPGSVQYHVPAAFRVHGPFDSAAFGRALDGVVARHDALRTRFASDGGEYRQMVVEEAAPARPVVADVPAAALDETLLEAARQPFDLERGPLLRCAVFAVDDGSHAVLLVAHHIICDGWSVQILLRELARGYAAAVRGEPDDIPPPAVQYPDYAAWQHERLAAGAYAGSVGYWRERLRGAPDTVALPTDRPRPPVQSTAAGEVRFALPPELQRRVESVAAARGVTPFTVVFAAFAVFLRRVGGQRDLVVGVPVSGRDRADVQGTVGMLTNTLAMRVEVGDVSFDALVDRAWQAVRDGQAHQDAPFSAVVDAVSPQRQLSYDPVVQVTLDYYDDAELLLELAGCRVEPVDVTLHAAKFDFLLYVERHGADLAARFIYRADLFDAATVRRWADAFRTLLDGLLDHPDRPVTAPELLDAAERRRMLHDWNRTDTGTTDALVPDLIAARAQASPDSVAVVCGEVCLTYRQLLERADGLAARLRTAGVGPEVTVGVCLPRSAEMAVSALAVLRAGGAYLPLDPGQPPARLTYLVSDSRTRLVLADRDRPDLPVAVGVVAPGATDLTLPAAPPTVAVSHRPTDPPTTSPADPPTRTSAAAATDPSADPAAHPPAGAAARSSADSGTEPAGYQAVRLAAGPPGGSLAGPGDGGRPGPLNLAYLLYTSGSTGTPKAVAVEHRALTNLATAVRPQFPVTADDRVLQYVSFGFDVAVSDLFFTWVAGAQLHIATDAERLGDALLDRLRDSAISYVFLPPAAAMSLPSTPGVLPDLRTLAVGGEPCPEELVERWDAPGRRVLDAYGPSECTVYSTIGVLRARRPVTIGRPVANMRAYLLDERLRPVPVGVVGEIYVTGDSLARGYAHRPGMTAERFVADPYGPPGARMYRTGDLGRFDDGGVLSYLGRTDTQVKVRGFRVELGEVETVLAAHPAVSAAAARVVGDPLDRRLAAYVVGERGASPDTAALRSWLAERLPGYLVPDAVVVLDALPLGPSGKLDRAALPEPPAARPELGQPYVAPSGETQRRLAEIWGRVLGMTRVGVRDNFFDLGGNSLRLLAVLTALRETGAAADVTLVDLFRHPTIAALAGHLDATSPASHAPMAPGPAPATAPAPADEPAASATGSARADERAASVTVPVPADERAMSAGGSAAAADRRGRGRRDRLAALSSRTRSRDEKGDPE